MFPECPDQENWGLSPVRAVPPHGPRGPWEWALDEGLGFLGQYLHKRQRSQTCPHLRHLPHQLQSRQSRRLRDPDMQPWTGVFGQSREHDGHKEDMARCRLVFSFLRAVKL